MELILIILIYLTVYRITRLVIHDSFPPVAIVRDFFLDRTYEGHWLDYLLGCYWCVSVYVGGLVVLATDLVVDVPYPWLVWISSSAITGAISTRVN